MDKLTTGGGTHGDYTSNDSGNRGVPNLCGEVMIYQATVSSDYIWGGEDRFFSTREEALKFISDSFDFDYDLVGFIKEIVVDDMKHLPLVSEYRIVDGEVTKICEYLA